MNLYSSLVRPKFVLLTLSTVCCAVVAGALHAQVAAKHSTAAAAPNPVPVPVPSKSGRVAHITADRWDDKKSPVGTIYSLLGHAKIVSDSTTTLTTDTAYYNDKTAVATAPGHLEISDPQNTIVGDSGLAYYTKRDAKINGNVHITMRPKPEMKTAPEGSPRREFKNPVFITCDHVDYDWKSRIAVATGSLVMKTEDRTITAEKATYYGNEETVVLTGKVHYSRPNSDFGDTEEAVAVLTEGKERFYSPGAGQVSITVDSDDENGTQSGASPIPPPPGTKPASAPTTSPTPAAPPSSPVNSPATAPPGGASPPTLAPPNAVPSSGGSAAPNGNASAKP